MVRTGFGEKRQSWYFIGPATVVLESDRKASFVTDASTPTNFR
ncbi:hypothetical protein NJ7G_3673 [Natrinema sp. J7-2]|nr:hypothetical protein NJ7G_3673 [Natrinema sp. J7-2]